MTVHLYDRIDNSNPQFDEYLLKINTSNVYTLYRFWEATLRQNAADMAIFLHPEAQISCPCTGEHFTAEEFIRVNCAYPGQWMGHIERIERCENLYITVTHVLSADGKVSCHATSFFRMQEGKILSIVEYWADDGPPPSWRTALLAP